MKSYKITIGRARKDFLRALCREHKMWRAYWPSQREFEPLKQPSLEVCKRFLKQMDPEWLDYTMSPAHAEDIIRWAEQRPDRPHGKQRQPARTVKRAPVAVKKPPVKKSAVAEPKVIRIEITVRVIDETKKKE